jgi:hypothetical protein
VSGTAPLISVMRAIQTDCHNDAMALDGKPFDGRTVAEQFGNMLASIQAVARAVEILASEASA